MLRKIGSVALLAAFVLVQVPFAAAGDFDVEAAKALFETKCSRCHPTSRPLSKHMDKDGWAMTVKRMQGKSPGWLTDDEVATVIEFLSKTQGK